MWALHRVQPRQEAGGGAGGLRVVIIGLSVVETQPRGSTRLCAVKELQASLGLEAR